MSSENRAGNVQANHCTRHGDFIGGKCPVCEGLTGQGGRPNLHNKRAHRYDVEQGLVDGMLDGERDPWEY